ncbi:MAG: carboxypeptidase-like regulatory domain-containing protein [Candidatus Gracilibacteria bacterium]|nr:carboxypeptidase-like regulatory domain-containing protein [Candidatus Gracilibacteria bacterium]
MYKKILYPVIIIFVGILLFFYLNINKSDNKTIIVDEKSHNGVLLSDILNQENYDKVGIDPTKYINFLDFLNDFKSYSGITIDPVKEKFVISTTGSGYTTLTSFDFKYDKYIFEDETNKNLAILDIYGAYKNNSIYGGADSNSDRKVSFDNDMDHPMTSQLTYLLDVNLDKDKNVFTMISSLESSQDLGRDNMEFLSYLYEFSGDYEKAKIEREKICEVFNGECSKNINITINGQVLDSEGKVLANTKVELINDKTINTITDNNGNYTLNFNNSDFSHLRLRAFQNGYSDGYDSLSVNNLYVDKLNYDINFKLTKSDSIISITDDNYLDYKKGKYYVINTDYSKYFVPVDGFYFEDGSNYIGNNFDVYLYLFKKDSNMTSLLDNDTFTPVYGYVGNIMKTFGMPYIQFIDKSTGKELFIKSSNPMILQNQIYHMKELYENYDQIYEALTEEDMKFLVSKSEELGGYPIDFDFLTENKMMRWPVWWSLDRKTGLWESVGSRVLNVDGLVELPFFHILDK